MLVFEPILDGCNYTQKDAIDYARGMVDAIDYARGMGWSEYKATEQYIKYKDYIDTIDGVGVYYDFGADYYFFTDETEGE